GVAARTLPADRLAVVHFDGDDRTAAGHGPVDVVQAVPSLLAACAQPAHGRIEDAPAELVAVLGDTGSWLSTPLDTRGYGGGLLLAGAARVGAFTQAHQDL